MKPHDKPIVGGSTCKVLVVPAEMVRYLREGLHSAMGDAAGGMLRVATLAYSMRDPGWYHEPLDHFDRIRRLLDLVGWHEDGMPSEVRLDLREHRQAIVEALRMEVSFAEDQLRDAEMVDAARVAEGDPPGIDAAAQHLLALRAFTESVEAQASTAGPVPFSVKASPTTELGIEIRARRRALKLTREQLSDVTDVSPRVLRELERDGSSVPMRVALRVLSALGLDADVRSRGSEDGWSLSLRVRRSWRGSTPTPSETDFPTETPPEDARYAVVKDWATRVLQRFQSWLIKHSCVISIVLGLGIGAVFLVKGITQIG